MTRDVHGVSQEQIAFSGGIFARDGVEPRLPTS